MSFSNAEKASEARREAGMRRSVYHRLVAEGRMTQAQADRRTTIMDEIAADYDRLDQPPLL